MMSSGKKLLLPALLVLGLACSSTPAAPSGGGAGGEEDATPATGGQGGAQAGGAGGLSPAGEGGAPGADAGPVPAVDAAASPTDTGAPADTGPAAIDGDAAASDPTPLGPFPLDAVKAAKPELYAAHGGHVEGISWRAGEIFFSVIPGGVFRIDADKKVSHYAALSSNGSFALADGSLLVCDDKHAVVQIFPDGKVGALGTAARCNDLTVDGWGNIWFSDFGNSISRITPDGVQTKPLTGLNSPNGIEVDPKNEFLYFLPRPNNIYRVAIDKDGPVGSPEKVGMIDTISDGCAFDAWGNLWASNYSSGKLSIFDPVKRAIIYAVPTGGGGLTNVTFGGPNRDEVFTTNDSKGIFRTPVGVRGFRGHPGAAKYTVKSFLADAPN
jgi:gluconolactonase